MKWILLLAIPFYLLAYVPVMGTNGMGEMYDMQHEAHIPNMLPMGSKGPHGTIEMSGMFTILKVRPSTSD